MAILTQEEVEKIQADHWMIHVMNRHIQEKGEGPVRLAFHLTHLTREEDRPMQLLLERTEHTYILAEFGIDGNPNVVICDAEHLHGATLFP